MLKLVLTCCGLNSRSGASAQSPPAPPQPPVHTVKKQHAADPKALTKKLKKLAEEDLKPRRGGTK